MNEDIHPEYQRREAIRAGTQQFVDSASAGRGTASLALLALVGFASSSLAAGSWNPGRHQAYREDHPFVNVMHFGASGRGDVVTRGRVKKGAMRVEVEATDTFHPGQGVYLYAENGAKLPTVITDIKGNTIHLKDAWSADSADVSVYHDDTPALMNAMLRLGSYGEPRLDNTNSHTISLRFPAGQYNLHRPIVLAAYSQWIGGEIVAGAGPRATLAALPGFAPDPGQERFLLYHHYDRIKTGTNSFWIYLANLYLKGLRPETNPGLSGIHFMGSHPTVMENVKISGFRQTAMTLASQDSVTYTDCVFDASEAPVAKAMIWFYNAGPWTPESMTFNRCRWIGNDDQDLIGIAVSPHKRGNSIPESVSWLDCHFHNVGRPVVLSGRDVSFVRCEFVNDRFPTHSAPAIEIEKRSDVVRVESCRSEGYAATLKTVEGKMVKSAPQGTTTWRSDGAQSEPAQPHRPMFTSPLQPPTVGYAQKKPLRAEDFGAAGGLKAWAAVGTDGRSITFRDPLTFRPEQDVRLVKEAESHIHRLVALDGKTATIEPATSLRGRVVVFRDDTAALQRAIHAASAVGAPLYLKGTYLVSDTLYAGDYTHWIGVGEKATISLWPISEDDSPRYIVSFERARPDRRIQRIKSVSIKSEGNFKVPPQVHGMLLNVDSPVRLTNVAINGQSRSFHGNGLVARGLKSGLVAQGLFVRGEGNSRGALIMEDCEHVLIKEAIIDGRGRHTVELRNCRDVEFGNIDTEAGTPLRSLLVEGGSDIHVYSWFNRYMLDLDEPTVEVAGGAANVSVSMMDFSLLAYRGKRDNDEYRLRLKYNGQTVLERPHLHQEPYEASFGKPFFWTNLPIGAAPAAVTGVKATRESGAVMLRWNPVAGAAEYLVYAGAGTAETGFPAGSTTKTEFTVPGVGDEAPAVFTIRACNAVGRGAPSEPVVVNADRQDAARPSRERPLFAFLGPPPPPEQVTFSPGDGQVLVRQNLLRPATDSILQIAESRDGPYEEVPVTVPVRQGHYVIKNEKIQNGKTIYMRVRAANYFGLSEPTSPTAVTPRAERKGEEVFRLDFDEHSRFTSDGGRRVLTEGSRESPPKQGEKFCRLQRGNGIQMSVANLKHGGEYNISLWVRGNKQGTPIYAGAGHEFRGVIQTPGEWQKLEIPVTYTSGHLRGNYLTLFRFHLHRDHPNHPRPEGAYLDYDDIRVIRVVLAPPVQH